jgi:hypothetical protein
VSAEAELIVECRRALIMQQRAVDELMTEFVSRKRAADWGVINSAGVAAQAALAKIGTLCQKAGPGGG